MKESLDHETTTSWRWSDQDPVLIQATSTSVENGQDSGEDGEDDEEKQEVKAPGGKLPRY